jgi:hypothetical protein
LVSSIGKLKKNKVISVNTAGDGKKKSRTPRIRTLRRTPSEAESRAIERRAARHARLHDASSTPSARARRTGIVAKNARNRKRNPKTNGGREVRRKGGARRSAPRTSPPDLALALVAGALQQLPLLVLAHLLAALLDDVSQGPTSSSPEKSSRRGDE